jgi:hypothetical protein
MDLERLTDAALQLPIFHRAPLVERLIASLETEDARQDMIEAD